MSDTETRPDAGAQGPPGAFPPGPVPTAIDVGVAHMGSTKTKMVVLSISTPQGIQHYFIEGDTTARLAKVMQKSARECTTWNETMKPSLILPGQQ